MVSLEKGLKEFHVQQDALEVTRMNERVSAMTSVWWQYSFALEDIWMFDFTTNMWAEVHIKCCLLWLFTVTAYRRLALSDMRENQTAQRQKGS